MECSISRPLIVGGNSGVGLSLCCQLLKQGAQKIYIIGKGRLDIENLDRETRATFFEKVKYIEHNFASFNISVLDGIDDIDALFITTGFGRVALFQDLDERELTNLLNVNFNAIVRIIRHYYYKIANKNDFYCAIMVSIAGHVVSPFLSAYGASKGGLRFLVENLNCELRSMGVANRILDVSPGVISGTKFYGGNTNLEALDVLSLEILEKAINREELFIPHFDSTYARVLKNYLNDPIQFGIDSFNYKLSGGRVSSKAQLVVGYLSGTFDLFHIGHLNLLRKAKEQCDYLVVSVHESGAWKGKETFIEYKERKAIVSSIKYVDEVVKDYLEDSDAWEDVRYNKLFVGSDYKGTERFQRYERILKGKADIVYFDYTDGVSSTQLRKKLKDGAKK